MTKQHFIINFDHASRDEAGIYADDLRNTLLDAGDGEIEVEKQQTDPNSQDFGATLVLILGTPAVIVLAKGIKDWLGRNPNASITVETVEGKVVATGVTSADAASIADKLLSK